MGKRVVSRELTEIRTVLTRSRTALRTIDKVDAWRHSSDHPDYYGGYYVLPDQVEHSDHELSMMRSALITSIDVLEKAEKLAGYREQ